MAVMRAQVQAQTQAQAIAHAQYNSQMQGVLQAKRVESLARAKSYFEKREQVLEQFKLWVARPQQRAVRAWLYAPKKWHRFKLETSSSQSGDVSNDTVREVFGVCDFPSSDSLFRDRDMTPLGDNTSAPTKKMVSLRTAAQHFPRFPPSIRKRSIYWALAPTVHQRAPLKTNSAPGTLQVI